MADVGSSDYLAGDYQLKKPNYGDYKKGGIGLYRRFLRGELAGRGTSAEQGARARAFADTAQGQRQANDQGTRAIRGSFGMNAPTGLETALRTQTAQSAPYGEANLAAEELGKRQQLRAGSALQASKQGQANFYATLIAPLLQKYGLDISQEGIGAQTALGLAGLGGSGGGGGGGGFPGFPGGGGGGGGFGF